MTNLIVDVSCFGGKRQTIPYDTFTFSGGEEHIRFNMKDISPTGVRLVMINARLVNSQTIMLLIMAVDAIREYFGNDTNIQLNCPYFPYARQDRVCMEGEAFAAQAMCEIINSIALDQVYITDPHSHVVKEWLVNCMVMPQEMLFTLHGQPQLKRVTTVVSPDRGATDKAKAVQEMLSIPYLIQAEKVRETDTGRITGVSLHGDVEGQNVLIPDDICDGGATFVGLGTMLKKMGAAHITLFVTHGIFSKGFGVFEGIIDSVITTNSFRTKSEYEAMNNGTTAFIDLHVMELEGL